MAESVFGPGFDLRSYIKKRALEINDLSERKLYRDVTENMMLELFQHLKQEQTKLEQRIFAELKSQQSNYAIYVGLTDRAHYDASDEFLSPIHPADVDQGTVLLSEALDAAAPRQVESVFLHMNAQDAQKFGAVSQTYFGSVTTEKGEYQASFTVKQNRRYLAQIEKLYHIFYANHVSWSTICTAYLHKMFDVFLLHADGPDQKSEEEIKEVKVDFGTYEPYIMRDMIPLWNLSFVQKDTSVYPSPCADHVHYEHKVFAHRLKPGHHYLVVNAPKTLQSIRFVNGDLLITCQSKQPVSWDLFQVNPRPASVDYNYPPFSNQPVGSFATDLGELYRRSVKTKAELRRVMESYGYADIVTFQDAELMESYLEETQTYDMDRFITDEFRRGNKREVMLLRFTPQDAEYYMNMDIMSFLVTQVQKLFPEYCCKGILV